MQTALNALSTISAAGGVTVAGGDGDAWTITFNENGSRDLLVATPDGDVTGDVTVVAGTEGAINANEVQSLSHSATEGAFSVSFEGEQSAPIIHNGSATDLQSVLNAMTNVTAAGGVTVTGAGTESSPYTITFNDPGDRDDLIAVGLRPFSGVPSVTTPTPGTASSPEVQRLSHRSTRGAYTLSFNGQTTAPIHAEASSAQLQNALEALSGIQSAGSVTVAPDAGGAEFANTISTTDDVTIDATSDGELYVFSLAAAVVTSGKGTKMSGSSAGGSSPSAGGADTAKPPSTGIGLAGDVSVNLVDDVAEAYINNCLLYTSDAADE